MENNTLHFSVWHVCQDCGYDREGEYEPDYCPDCGSIHFEVDVEYE
mgnify:CR=1 FL=1